MGATTAAAVGRGGSRPPAARRPRCLEPDPMVVPVESVTLILTFNTTFRVGTGSALEGVDISLDPARPLPASSLKGRMREAARVLLGPDGGSAQPQAPIQQPATRIAESPDPKDTDKDPPLVRAVFGDERRPSPWHWDDVKLEARVVQRTRVRLGEDRVAKPGALRVADEAVARCGRTRIWQQAWVEPGEMPLHLALLRCSARLVEAVGAEKSRGLGWVTLDVENEVPPSDVDLVLRARERGVR